MVRGPPKSGKLHALHNRDHPPTPRLRWQGGVPYGSQQWKNASKKRVRLLPPDMRSRSANDWLNKTDSSLLSGTCVAAGGHYNYSWEKTRPLVETSFLAQSAPHCPEKKSGRRASMLGTSYLGEIKDSQIRRQRHPELLSVDSSNLYDSTLSHMTEQPQQQHRVTIAHFLSDSKRPRSRELLPLERDHRKHVYPELFMMGPQRSVGKDSSLVHKYNAAAFAANAKQVSKLTTRPKGKPGSPDGSLQPVGERPSMPSPVRARVSLLPFI